MHLRRNLIAKEDSVEQKLAKQTVNLLKKLIVLYDSLSFDEVLEGALEIFSHTLQFDILDWYELDPQRGIQRFKSSLEHSCDRQRLQSRLQKIILQHPVLYLALRGDQHLVYRLSDCISWKDASTHPLYKMHMLDYHAPYALIVRIPIPGHGFIVISMKRADSDFSDAEIATAKEISKFILRKLQTIVTQQKKRPCIPPYEYIDRIERLLHLSRREAEISYWVFMCKHNKEIACTLGISAHTVRTHLQNIFRKQSVSTRLDLAHKILQADISPLPQLKKKALPKRKGFGD